MLSHLATATLVVAMSTASPQAPVWQSDYGDALEATRATNQPLLVVIDKPQEEGARINPELLSNGAIDGQKVQLLNEFELCHIDASTKYGRAVAKAFRAEKYPYMAIIDKTGSVILYSKSGNIESKDIDRALKDHKTGERTRVRVASNVRFEQSNPVVIQQPMSRPSFNNSYCPSCQRRPM